MFKKIPGNTHKNCAEIFEKIPGNIPEDSGKCLNRFQGIYLKDSRECSKRFLGRFQIIPMNVLKTFSRRTEDQQMFAGLVVF